MMPDYYFFLNCTQKITYITELVKKLPADVDRVRKIVFSLVADTSLALN